MKILIQRSTNRVYDSRNPSGDIRYCTPVLHPCRSSAFCLLLGLPAMSQSAIDQMHEFEFKPTACCRRVFPASIRSTSMSIRYWCDFVSTPPIRSMEVTQHNENGEVQCTGVHGFAVRDGKHVEHNQKSASLADDVCPAEGGHCPSHRIQALSGQSRVVVLIMCVVGCRRRHRVQTLDSAAPFVCALRC